MKKIVIVFSVVCLTALMSVQDSFAQTENNNKAKIDSLSKLADDEVAKITKEAEIKRLQKKIKEDQIRATNDSIVTARKEIAEKNKERQAELFRLAKLRNDSIADARKAEAQKSREAQREKNMLTRQKNDSIAFERKRITEIKSKEAEALRIATDEKNRKIENAKKEAMKDKDND